jgi:antitoxin component YwqK of YwqJK toxin-antitoxin module
MKGIIREISLWSLCLLFTLISRAQDARNTYDSNEKKHGRWVEYYNNNKSQPKYEGRFEHGKRTGLFKFYQEGLKQPVAVMNFDRGSGSVKAKYLAQDGSTISEGEFTDQKRTGLWTYYHKGSDAVMMTENYVAGKLHGQKKVYYENGQLAEEAAYSKGELNGPRKLYSVKGVVLEDLLYENGKLHGPAKIYNGKGELLSEGLYRNDKHHGTWKYYENGSFKEEKEF